MAIMDITLEYIMEAQHYIDNFIEISLADSFFEDTNDAKSAIEHNESMIKGALNALKKAVKALIQKVKDAIESLADFFKTMSLPKDERERYKEFKAEIKSNPQLANIKITIDDFREYEKIYDEVLKTIDDEIKKEESKKEPSFFENLISNMSKKLKEISKTGGEYASRAAAAVTLNTAVDIADKNVLCARAINAALKHELVSLEEVEKVLGKKEVAKYQKKIQKYANNGFLHRMKVKILYRKKATLESVLKKQRKQILSYTNIDPDTLEIKNGKSVASKLSLAKGVVKNPKLTTTIMGGPKATLKTVGKAMTTPSAVDQVSGYKKTLKTDTKEIKREFNDLKKFILGK